MKESIKNFNFLVLIALIIGFIVINVNQPAQANNDDHNNKKELSNKELTQELEELKLTLSYSIRLLSVYKKYGSYDPENDIFWLDIEKIKEDKSVSEIKINLWKGEINKFLENN